MRDTRFAVAMAGDENFPVPTDVFVSILMLLPTSCRRRLRLVCKTWRDVVDERTPERQVRTKVLAFISKRQSSRALVFDDDRRREWTFPSSGGFAGVVDMVGTSNGLLCLHETAPCGDRGVSVLTVANPVTGETRRLPPVPPARSHRSLGRYVFGYHPITGRYKFVHIPSSSSWSMLDAVQVLDLGEPSWREVC
ncbi:hypothetical protein HU200_043684 [Digitaria exilis]|uniref:F-box domain-containing protein n=1 Tax=Digitaria exilis TaxID=1010633 RepID=A0A835EBT1_9POAL|nr:hypothetical protein HU200_043684 [Digitaria exilis]